MELITFTTIDNKTITINLSLVMAIELSWEDEKIAKIHLLLTSNMTLTYDISPQDFDYIQGVIDHNSLDMYRG